MNLLIKPASSLCNLRCRYCFYLDSAENRITPSYGVMSEETLKNLTQKALMAGEREVTFAFQGGEPTLAGLVFFKKAVEFQKKYNTQHVKVSNAIQTNGIVMNEEWAQFLKENQFLVGISLDGTKECHDAFRLDAEGKGTYQRVMKSIGLLEQYGVDFNILTVVNSQTAKKIQSIYSFFKKCNFPYLQFIPCLQPFGHEGEKLPFTLSAKDWGIFLGNLFDLWYRDFMVGKAPHIRQFENYVEMLLGYPPESCGMSGICSMQNVIEADGGCYPCDFYVLDRYLLGNLNTVDFKEINKRREELLFIEQSANIHEKCRQCKYLNICRGGCKRYCEPFSKEERSLNVLCEGYYQFFQHSGERLVSIAKAVGIPKRQ